MKKVLFTATVDSHILQFHLPFLKMFKENGYEVHVATNGNETIPYCDKKHIVCFERSPLKVKNIIAMKQLKKIIKNEKFDIVHCHTPMGSVVTRLAAKNARKKGTRVIYTAHGFHFYKGAPIINWLLYYPVEWYLAKYTDTLITINTEDYERAKKKFSKRCKDIQYVPGVGINPKKFDFEMSEEEKLDLRKSLRLKKDDFVMIYPARLDKNKNQKFLINAMEQLVKEHDDIHLLLPGKDELNGKYQKITKKKGLENNIHFLGHRNDIPQLLKISDLAVSASKREGLPINILEAMACKLPVVALRCRGIEDLINDSNNGYSVYNEDNFIEKIKIIYNNTKQNKKLPSNIHKNFNNYKLDNILKLITKIYFKKKKVLHLLASNSYSGAEHMACTIIQNLSNSYDMIYCSPDGIIKETLNEKNIGYLPLKKLSLNELKKAINKYNPDIIHAHDNRASVLASFFSKKHIIISHIHGNNKIMNSFNLLSYTYNLVSRKFKKIIWVSDSCLNNYYFKKNVTDKSIVLYNIVNKDEIIEKSNLYKCNKEYDLIFIGRLAYPKNPERLIEIVKLLKYKKKDITMAIVGDGIERPKIENLIKKYNLDNNITLYGFQKNPYPILKNSKILIMTSIYEGTPMVALEAQALGKPIISTPVDGLKDIILNGKDGYLLKENIEFVNIILKLLKNQDKYKELINNSLQKFNTINNNNEYFITINKMYLQ